MTVQPTGKFGPAPRLRVKRGDTLALDCQVDVDLNGWAVRAQIRRGPDQRLLADCDVAILGHDAEAAITHFAVTVPAGETAQWPLGSAEMDIEYTDPAGVVQTTETVALDIQRDITR